MAAKKYLSHVTGSIQEVQATVTSAGAGDDGKLVALDATGKLDASVLPGTSSGTSIGLVYVLARAMALP